MPLTEHYLLLVTLGPVQDFIASARRCRDLWFGSWLLSDLSRAAALGMVEHHPEHSWLIFPGATVQASLQQPDVSVSNRILLRVRASEEEVRQIAEAGRGSMVRRLEQLASDAFDRVGRNHSRRDELFHEDVAKEQVADLMEYLWVAVPEGDDYVKARGEVERLMSARKATKTWGPVTWGKAGVPKSSLDGVRESVLDEALYDVSVVPGVRTNPPTTDQRRRWYGVHGSERLCGVGLLKRHGRMISEDGQVEERFLSTSHLAALPWMLGVTSESDLRLPQVQQKLTRLLGSLGDDFVFEEFRVGGGQRRDVFEQLDGSLFFENRLRDTLEEWGTPPDEVKGLVDKQRAVIRAADRGDPIPYYCILVADGDRMGKVIDAQETFEAHRELSESLEAFAKRARVIVTEHHGSPLYAGGDDVLALLPMHTALSCVVELAATFGDALAKWKDDQGNPATLSAGLAMVHHIMPLDEALIVARNAEQVAKHDAGRNALCVTVAKRGGSPVVAKGHWGEVDRRIQSLVQLRLADAVSDRAGHELMQLQSLTHHAKGERRSSLLKVQYVEALRILGRKRAAHGQRALAESTLQQLQGMLQGCTPSELGRELYVADLLTRSIQQAGTRQEEEVD